MYVGSLNSLLIYHIKDWYLFPGFINEFLTVTL